MTFWPLAAKDAVRFSGLANTLTAADKQEMHVSDHMVLSFTQFYTAHLDYTAHLLPLDK